MGRTTTTSILAVLLMACGTAQSAAEPLEIVVRTFNNYRVSADVLHAAQNHASALLDEAVKVTWLHCWYGNAEPAGAPARCRAPQRPNDLTLRLHAATKPTSHRYVTLGASLVMRYGLPFLATVYADLAESVANHAGVQTGTVLGLSIAHEIGHLLLNSTHHANSGLMSARWSPADLRRSRHDDWRLLDSEVAALQSAVLARLTTGN